MTTATDDIEWMRLALAGAQRSYRCGSIPVGAALVSPAGQLALGRNRSVETNDLTSHAEIDCLRMAGLGRALCEATLYTTLSPCSMCAGAVAFLGIRRVVIGDATSYLGEIDWLRSRGVEVDVLEFTPCRELLEKFIAENPTLWNRTIDSERPRDR